MANHLAALTTEFSIHGSKPSSKVLRLLFTLMFAAGFHGCSLCLNG
jgi:hypothetical protein